MGTFSRVVWLQDSVKPSLVTRLGLWRWHGIPWSGLRKRWRLGVDFTLVVTSAAKTGTTTTTTTTTTTETTTDAGLTRQRSRLHDMYKALWWAEIITKGLTMVWQQPKYLKQLLASASRAEQYLYCKRLCPSSGLMRLGRMATRCSWLSRMEPMYKDGFHILRAQEVPLFLKPLSPKRVSPCTCLKTSSKDSQAVLNIEHEYLYRMIDKYRS